MRSKRQHPGLRQAGGRWRIGCWSVYADGEGVVPLLPQAMLRPRARILSAERHHLSFYLPGHTLHLFLLQPLPPPECRVPSPRSMSQVPCLSFFHPHPPWICRLVGGGGDGLFPLLKKKCLTAARSMTRQHAVRIVSRQCLTIFPGLDRREFDSMR